MVTGPPDPAQPTRAERDAYATAQLHRAAALRKAGRPDLAREVPLRMPDRPSDLQLAPWEAVLAQALQQDEPERTALEVIQAAQDFTTHTAHLFQLRQAFWHLDVVPKIDEMVRERIPAAAYERYLKDPERPAFLNLLREHEIGGRADRGRARLDHRRAADRTAQHRRRPPWQGGKRTTPGRGGRRRPGLSGPRRRLPPRSKPLAGWRTSGRPSLAARSPRRPPQWAVQAWGRPPAEPGALQDDWQRQAGLVGSYRELAGITDPAQAIGPVPSGQPELAEMFHASVRALQLPDDEALLKAMGQGELEADVDKDDRARVLARPDVQPEIDQRAAQLEDAQVRAHIAGGNRDAEAQAEAEAQAREAAADLAHLAVADAARREWTEAHAGLMARAEAAERELRARGLAERIPVTDAEVATASAEPRETPAIDPETWAQMKAEQAAQVDADRQARAETSASLTPVTDAEIDRYGAGAEPEAGAAPEAEPEAEAVDGGQDRPAALEEIRQEVEAISAKVDQLPDPAAERRAEMTQAGIDEPVVHEPQAEPSLEASWQPGNAQGQYEPDAEAEMEL